MIFLAIIITAIACADLWKEKRIGFLSLFLYLISIFVLELCKN